jgi:hypothetical protein
MRRILTLVVAALAVQVAASADRPSPGGVTEKEVHAARQAWQYSGVDLPQGSEARISATGGWEINPTWEKKVGAGGNSEYKAADNYVKPGANEGCLLVKVGDTVRAFAKDGEVIRVTTPGKIYFCANDLPTDDGFTKAKEYANAVPIPAAKDAGGDGFLDNSGTLKVRIEVKKADQ